jgi:hypothetical protein
MANWREKTATRFGPPISLCGATFADWRQVPHPGICVASGTKLGGAVGELGAKRQGAVTGDRTHSQEVGFDHHMVKPADFSKVQQILATAPKNAN